MRIAVLAFLLLGACSLEPDYETPNIAYPDQWEQPGDTALTAPSHWWEGFQDPQLNRLVDAALAQNNNLAAAIARVEQARASARTTGATRLPQLGVNATTRQNLNQGEDATSQATATLSYELDLFGKNNSRYRSAIAAWEASGYDRQALAITVAGDVSENYIGWLLTQERLRIARANLANTQEVLQIVEARTRVGRDSGLELAQQQQQVASAAASIASLESTADAYRYQIALLLGEAPQGFMLQPASFAALTVPSVAASLPSTLLQQRPDIAAAEAELRAAHADIGAARAAFFPSPTLGLEGALLEGSAPVYAVTGSLLQTIFSGGALEGELERSNARQEELVALYRDTVLTAFKEASLAQSQRQTDATRVTSLEQGAASAAEAYRIARRRYEVGSTDFTTLLTTERTRFTAEDSSATARFDLLQSTINLYRATSQALE